MTGEITLSGPQAHDLEHLLEDLCVTYFGRTLPVRASWGKRRRGVHSRSLGLYYPDRAEIVIAGELNTRRVPRYVIEHLLFHELCHHVQHRSGPPFPHDDAFRAMEARYRHHVRALRWIAKHICEAA